MIPIWAGGQMQLAADLLRADGHCERVTIGDLLPYLDHIDIADAIAASAVMIHRHNSSNDDSADGWPRDYDECIRQVIKVAGDHMRESRWPDETILSTQVTAYLAALQLMRSRPFHYPPGHPPSAAYRRARSKLRNQETKP